MSGAGGSTLGDLNPAAQVVRFPVDEDRKQNVLGTATVHDDHIDVPPRGWAIHHGTP